MNPLRSTLRLPCGATLKNRLCKTAMTEGLADADDCATDRHDTLYGRWSEGGAGLLVTGNVMVDRRYLERPGNIVVDGNGGHAELARLAKAGSRHGNHAWVQINHPGRQCTRMSNGHPVSPSAVKMRGMLGLIAAPRALEPDEIRDVIRRFAYVAKTSKAMGFTGVQIHSAHGYLSSQFLSPHSNRRTDEWGGSLENRARFLFETLRAIRTVVGSHFPISVKLNSSDFQKGGFSHEDSATVARWLCDEGVDLLEISGGTYEQLAILGRFGADEKRKAESTRRREAYFLEYARLIREAAKDVPLMVTGGFRTVSLMEEVVASGEVDVVGLARPFCLVPDLPAQVFKGSLSELPAPEKQLRLGPGVFGPASPLRSLRTLNAQAEVAWFYRQIIALSEGGIPDLELGAWEALLAHFRTELAVARARSLGRPSARLPTSKDAPEDGSPGL